MVAVDKERKPQRVPTLVPETPEQKARFTKAEHRKRSRQELHARKSQS
jgi:acyl-CoA hydrolase